MTRHFSFESFEIVASKRGVIVIVIELNRQAAIPPSEINN